MDDQGQMMRQVGEYFKRKYGLVYEIGPHPMTDAPNGAVDIWDDNDEPYYAATLVVSYDPDPYEGWDIHISQGRQGSGTDLKASATVRQAIAAAEKWARQKSDLLPEGRRASTDDAGLRKAVIKLAHERKDLRPYLLPLVRKGGN